MHRIFRCVATLGVVRNALLHDGLELGSQGLQVPPVSDGLKWLLFDLVVTEACYTIEVPPDSKRVVFAATRGGWQQM